MNHENDRKFEIRHVIRFFNTPTLPYKGGTFKPVFPAEGKAVLKMGPLVEPVSPPAVPKVAPLLLFDESDSGFWVELVEESSRGV